LNKKIILILTLSLTLASCGGRKDKTIADNSITLTPVQSSQNQQNVAEVSATIDKCPEAKHCPGMLSDKQVQEFFDGTLDCAQCHKREEQINGK